LERGKTLRRAGATHVIKDFTNYIEVMRCLEQANIPAASGARYSSFKHLQSGGK
jgi:hypothetical protein